MTMTTSPVLPPEDAPPRTSFAQPVTKKEIQPGDAFATCGHVVGAAVAQCFLFDGFWEHETLKIQFLACCPACAVGSNFDLSRVSFVDAHVAGAASGD